MEYAPGRIIKKLVFTTICLMILAGGTGILPGASAAGIAWELPKMDWALGINLPITAQTGEILIGQVLTGTMRQRPRESAGQVLTMLTGTAFGEPSDILASVVRPLQVASLPVSAGEPGLTGEVGKEQLPPIETAGSYPPLAIYCTHNAETYVPDEHVSRLEGKAGLICEVAAHMADYLTQKGCKAAYDNTIHDAPDYNLAYACSRETVERLLEETPEAAVMIDVHRDAFPTDKSPETVMIDGRKAARILIVIGSDQRRPNPRWQENQRFADQIADKANQRYPGLVRGVRVKAGTYNQELHIPSMLVEIGNQYNSFQEATYSAELFDNILLEAIRETGS